MSVINARRWAVVELAGGAAGVVVAASAGRRAQRSPPPNVLPGRPLVVHGRILNAGSAFQVLKCLFEMADQALQPDAATPREGSRPSGCKPLSVGTKRE